MDGQIGGRGGFEFGQELTAGEERGWRWNGVGTGRRMKLVLWKESQSCGMK
jgi:hypothetical protein